MTTRAAPRSTHATITTPSIPLPAWAPVPPPPAAPGRAALVLAMEDVVDDGDSDEQHRQHDRSPHRQDARTLATAGRGQDEGHQGHDDDELGEALQAQDPRLDRGDGPGQGQGQHGQADQRRRQDDQPGAIPPPAIPVGIATAWTRRRPAEAIPAATNSRVGPRAAARNAAWLASGRSPAYSQVDGQADDAADDRPGRPVRVVQRAAAEHAPEGGHAQQPAPGLGPEGLRRIAGQEAPDHAGPEQHAQHPDGNGDQGRSPASANRRAARGAVRPGLRGRRPG